MLSTRLDMVVASIHAFDNFFEEHGLQCRGSMELTDGSGVAIIVNQ